MSFALDVDNQTLTGYYNNKVIFIDTSIPNASTTQYAPFVFSTNGSWSDAHFNFGQRPFKYTPPDGYETISIANIPHIPKIIKPENFFLYFSRITGISNAPGTWMTSNSIFDSFRT